MSRIQVAVLIVFVAVWVCVGMSYFLHTTRAQREDDRARAREDDDGSHIW